MADNEQNVERKVVTGGETEECLICDSIRALKS